MHLFFVFLTALLVSTLAVTLLVKLAYRFNLVDQPDSRKAHKRPVPRVGGLGIALGSAVAIYAWHGDHSMVSYFLAGAAVVVLLGFWDDLRNLDYRIKLVGQFAAALVVVGPGHLLLEHASWFGFAMDQPLQNAICTLVTLVVLVGTMNATNLSDGLDGLAAGLSLLSLGCIGILAAPAGAPNLIVITVAIIGGTIGFLRYNTHPAFVFMGDSGSLLLGFSVGVLALWLTQRANTALSPEVLLLLLGVPIIDMARVMLRRAVAKQSIFTPDRGHLHHRLLDIGFDHYEAVLAIYVAQALFVAAAYFLRFESAWLILACYAALFMLVFSFDSIALWTGWRRAPLASGLQSPLARSVRWLRGSAWLAKFLESLIVGLILWFIWLGAAVVARIPVDIGYFALAMVGISVVIRLLNWPLVEAVQRMAIYAAAIFACYSWETAEILALSGAQHFLLYFFIVFAVIVALAMRYSHDDGFSVTTSDFLLMFILLAGSQVPWFAETNAMPIAIESAILLYGAEFVLRRRTRSVFSRTLWGGCLVGFLLAGWKALL